MENRFNFLDQAVLSALKDAAHLLPGLDQVDLMYHDQKEDDILLKRVKGNDNTHIKSVKINSAMRSEFRKFRKQIRGSGWYEPNELPFATEKNLTANSNIFDEILKSILCIGVPNLLDGSQDVFVFYFRRNASEFGPVSNDRVLETQQKVIIERLLVSSLKGILKAYNQNREAMITYNRNINQLLESRKSQINEQDKQLKEVVKEMDAILVGLLNELKDVGDIVVLTEKAKLILRSHLSDIHFVKEKIRKALNFAKTITYGLDSPEIVLHEDYFYDIKKDLASKSKKETQVVDAYSADTKMFRFLDSLEIAARTLSDRGVKLTSANVGSSLSQPITAAAISDKLKNHGRKINLLLEQYPENWKLIRYKFRPVVNIQERVDDYKVA